ncbi:taste receptor type 2 member 42-like [Tupaia chinensis]|uniref:taste receptor type 2 member 42-like n=1 Tax=Tupaia chinensis TaxID=246437 RepID=UPI000703E65E|nr:taste receptor type 2 member 42-like [Tupaia chinensis]
MSIGMKISFLALATGELLAGMLGNGLIGLVNCMEWVRSRKVSSADFILTSLSMARIIQLWVILFDSFIMGLFPHLYATGKLAKLVTILWALMNHLTTWFATCLSVFYLFKIANFSHFFFTWLKWRMNRVVLVLFLGSLLLLPVSLSVQDPVCELWMNAYRVDERNMTLHLDGITMSYFKNHILLSMTYIIPFLLSLTSLLLLLLSLVRHTKNLQLNGSKDSSTEAHKRAMKMVTTFLFLFVIYFASTLIGSWMLFKVQRYQAMMFVMVISTVFPSGHAFIIILGNSEDACSKTLSICSAIFKSWRTFDKCLSENIYKNLHIIIVLRC